MKDSTLNDISKIAADVRHSKNEPADEGQRSKQPRKYYSSLKMVQVVNESIYVQEKNLAINVAVKLQTDESTLDLVRDMDNKEPDPFSNNEPFSH